MRAAVVIVIMTGSAGCLKGTVFECATNIDCGAGNCELTGYCSFADTGCESGWRYGEHSADLSGTCVGAETPDGPPGQPDAAIDASIDAGPDLCPTTYAFLGGGLNHKYRLLGTVLTKNQQETVCQGDGAYLAIPDDANELTQVTGLSGNIWVGVSDQVTENMWLTSLGATATFLPWATGEPDDQGPGEDCVMATATLLYYDERCGDRHPAVCECVP